MTDVLNDRAIRTRPYPDCIACGSRGEPLYAGQTDRLFGAWGSWDLKHCRNAGCGLIWLDPMPVEEDIGKAYLQYYTHNPELQSQSALGRVRQSCELAYICRRFGYPGSSGKFWQLVLGFLAFHREGGTTFLDWKQGGKLLDVGCGAGAYLGFMRSLGWQVEGVEFDEAAVAAAGQMGLHVQLGTLHAQNYPPASFDAIVMNHVIEHVPDPVATLAECFRILKAGGKLMLFTPNNSSLTHSIFKENWRGLEIPRHLHVFSMKSIVRVLQAAGFKEVCVRPQATSSVISDSCRLLLLAKGSQLDPKKFSLFRWSVRLSALLEGCLARLRPSSADCLAAVATKEPHASALL